MPLLEGRKYGNSPWRVGIAAFGGTAAAFGVAACCALPFLLSGIGLSVGWLTGIALLASPHTEWLMIVSALSLAFAAWQWGQMQRTAMHATGPGASPRWLRLLLLIAIVAGMVLLVLGYIYV